MIAEKAADFILAAGVRGAEAVDAVAAVPA